MFFRLQQLLHFLQQLNDILTRHLKNILNMPRDHGLVSLKQFCHLFQRQPDSIVFKRNIDFCQSVFCLVNDHPGLALFTHADSILH